MLWYPAAWILVRDWVAVPTAYLCLFSFRLILDALLEEHRNGQDFFPSISVQLKLGKQARKN